MKKIKIGLAAFGMSGQIFHAPFISTNMNFELTAIVERSKDLSKVRYPQVHIMRSLEELLASDVEIVVINTPDSTHYPFARQALKAGKNVIIEKPFCTTTEEGKELITLAKQKGLMLSVFQNRRWDSDFLTIKEIIDYELLGRLVEFESTFPRYRNYIKQNTWKETGEQGGGLIYNLGSHVIDQAVQLFGVPEALYADIDTMRTNGIVDDYFLIHFIHPSKVPSLKVTLKSSYLMCEPEPRFILHGTEGSYIKYGFDCQEADLNAGKKPNSPHWGEENESIWGLLRTEKGGSSFSGKYPSVAGNYAEFYANIFAHLRYKEALITDAKDVLPVIQLIEAAIKSSHEQTVIKIE